MTKPNYECDGCGKECYVKPHQQEKNEYCFCSQECYQSNRHLYRDKCSYEKCDNHVKASGRKYCSISCLGLQRGLENSGSTCESQGYVLEKMHPDDPMISMAKASGWVHQHRLIMARHIGRVLSADEQVHHINGERADNRIENLQLRQGSHGNGAQFICGECGSKNVVAKKI